MRNYKTIIVNKKGEDRLKNNHPWVFEGNIESKHRNDYKRNKE